MEEPSDTNTRFDDLEQDYMDLKIANLKLIDWDMDRIETARADGPATDCSPIGGGEDVLLTDDKPKLAVDSLVTQGIPIHHEVMLEFLKMKIQEEGSGDYELYHIPNVFDFDESRTFKEIDALIRNYNTQTVFVVYQVRHNLWHLIVAKKDVTYPYRSTRDETHPPIIRLLRHLGTVRNVNSWPISTNTVAFGVLVILLIEHFLIKEPFYWDHTDSKKEVEGFRKRALEELEQHFQLTVNGSAYSSRSYPGNAVALVRYPELHIDALNPEKPVDDTFMEKYLEYLFTHETDKTDATYFNIGTFPTHRNGSPDKELIKVKYETIQRLFSKTRHIVYVTYRVDDQWRLFIIEKKSQKDKSVKYYDTLALTANELLPGAAQFIGLMSKKWKKERLEWPTTRNHNKSGKLVILAIQHHHKQQNPLPASPPIELSEPLETSPYEPSHSNFKRVAGQPESSSGRYLYSRETPDEIETFKTDYERLLTEFKDCAIKKLRRQFKLMMNGKRLPDRFTGRRSGQLEEIC